MGLKLQIVTILELLNVGTPLAPSYDWTSVLVDEFGLDIDVGSGIAISSVECRCSNIGVMVIAATATATVVMAGSQERRG